MNDDRASMLLYALMILLPLSALIARRPPLGRTLTMALLWIGIFAVALLLVGQRERISRFLSGQPSASRSSLVTRSTHSPIFT